MIYMMAPEQRNIPVEGYTVEDEARLLRLSGLVVRSLRDWIRIATFFAALDALESANSWVAEAGLGELFLMLRPYELLPLNRGLLGFYPELFGIEMPRSARELMAMRNLPEPYFPDYFGLTQTQGFREKYRGGNVAQPLPTQLTLFAR